MSGVARTALRVVPMASDHLEGVRRIDALVHPVPWSEALLRQELSEPSRLYLVALDGGVQVGHAGVMLMPPGEGHVTTVAVDPAHQGRGIATSLMLALHQGAVERGARSLTLEVRVSNERAIALYRRFGYAPAGLRKGYYASSAGPGGGAAGAPGEDALIMWAHDVDGDEHRARLAAIREEVGRS